MTKGDQDGDSMDFFFFLIQRARGRKGREKEYFSPAVSFQVDVFSKSKSDISM